MFGLFKNFFGAGSAEICAAIDQGAFLVDVRTPGEFASGSVQNAVNIPLDKIETQLAKFQNKKQIVVFCRSGARSGQAKKILEKCGINCTIINGGGVQQVHDALNTK